MRTIAVFIVAGLVAALRARGGGEEGDSKVATQPVKCTPAPQSCR
jgi:hypothetical protein